MMTSLLRKLVVDVPALNENTIVPLRVGQQYFIVNHQPIMIGKNFKLFFHILCTNFFF